ncbi:hypothetical protein F444_18466 [Phytophthora nicotianae P1976]|uniref:Uncharacterized protein n=1 Tax=Phytophthora nicotianae P1976 TaxID=1317066 RepID=A0A080ZB90_PHYNI|nr:hypothetical protein F444_18466 [Phytophthora nicotianae P1976]
MRSRKDRERRDGGASEKSKSSDGAVASHGRGSNPPAEGCLHCGGAHWLRECPTASENDRRKALEKLRSQRDASRSLSKAVRNDRRPQTGEVLVDGLVTAPYYADSGSDRSVIPRALAYELVVPDSRVQLRHIDEPMVVTVAGGGQVDCEDEVEVDLLLQMAAGAVRVSNVTCLVMSGGETEFLLDDDPFELEELQVTEGVLARLEAMCEAVLQKRIDPDLYEELRQVEPLTVTLKPDAVPFRAKPRKCAPAQREFLRQELKRLEDLG